MATTAGTARAVGDVPPPTGPSARLLVNEALVGVHALRLLAQLPRLAARRSDVARAVTVLPGWLASDRSTVVLRRALARDGHHVRGWERGRNSGDIDEHVRATVAAVDRRAAATRAPVDLIGWSLGGVIARAAARISPGSVRRIITLGTPLRGPDGTVFAPLFDGGPDRRPTPPPVPTTIVWSRRDGIVSWQSQLDHDNPWAEHVEVRTRHFGLGLDPTVLQLVRDLVAADVDRPTTAALGR